MKKDVVVIGLGNPLMTDEGIGVRLIDCLAELGGEAVGIDFIDAGTGGFSVIHQIEGRRKAVFIDCAYMGAEPGSIKRFSPEDVKSEKVLAHQSLHEADLLKILDMAKELGQSPDEIVIFGIEPAAVKPGFDLSEKLESRLDDYVSVICAELGL